MYTDFWASLTGPLADQIRVQQGIQKRARETATELHQTEQTAGENIERLRAQLCVRKLNHWLGRLHWKFDSSHQGSPGYNGFPASPPFVSLVVDESHPDHNQDAVEELHYLLGFGHHDSATLMEGVWVRVNDGVVDMSISTSMLSTFLETAELSVDWSKLGEGIEGLEQTLRATVASLDALKTLQFIATEGVEDLAEILDRR